MSSSALAFRAVVSSRAPPRRSKTTARRAATPSPRVVVVRSSEAQQTASTEPAPAPVAPPSEKPIVVFGANGKTGKRCVAHAAKAGVPVVACTRSGSFASADLAMSADDQKLVTAKAGDVSKASQAELEALVSGAGAIIFAASASPGGGSPQDVDKAGLVAVARAAIAANVPRLVIVSSGSVSKPLSPVYVFLNFFGGIMRAKIEGEDAVRALYFNREDADYVCVRPGGLTEDPGQGVRAIELNQGDDKSGRISREDVAAICVEAARAAGTPAAKNATFECYWKDTAKSLGEVGLSNMMGGTSNEAEYVSGKERRGESWEELFDGLESDAAGVAQQGWGPSL